jgi:Ala-tRNA(Pro) deacylase
MTPVEQFLTENGIEYTLHEHPAVFTCEDAERECANVPGIAGKNLFLKGKKTGTFFLVILPATKRADLKKIAETVGEKISFASPEALMEKLGLEPGSVSPFGLLNDTNKKVQLYIDGDILASSIVNFHPNKNTASLELSQIMFQKFLETVGYTIHTINL